MLVQLHSEKLQVAESVMELLAEIKLVIMQAIKQPEE
jgi:hypothetical protein